MILLRMKHIIMIFLSIVVGCASKETSSRWTTTDNLDEFVPVELKLTEFSFNKHPIILTKTELLQIYGKPDSIAQGSGYFPEKVRKSRTKSTETVVKYERYYYGNLYYAVWKDNAQLKFVYFNNESNLTLNHPKVVLSKNTGIDEFKTKFLYTYEWRNYPLHRQFGLDPKDEFGWEKEDCTWLEFSNGLDPFHRNIELTFLKGKLIWIEFLVVEEKYRP